MVLASCLDHQRHSGHAVEDIKISDCIFLHGGGGPAELAALQPPERPEDYPEPAFFGPLPAQHFYLRHVRNIEFSNVEVASVNADARPSFWLGDVSGADLLNVKFPRYPAGLRAQRRVRLPHAVQPRF